MNRLIPALLAAIGGFICVVVSRYAEPHDPAYFLLVMVFAYILIRDVNE